MLGRVVADRNRNFADAERVEHRELSGCEAADPIAERPAGTHELERPGVVRLLANARPPGTAPGAWQPVRRRCGTADALTAPLAVHVQQPHAGVLQALDDDLGEQPEDVVAQRGIGRELAAQARAVERDRVDRCRAHGRRTCRPVRRRRATTTRAGRRREGSRSSSRRAGARTSRAPRRRNAATKKRVGGIALAQEVLAGLEAAIASASGDQLAMLGRELARARRSRLAGPQSCASPRIAAASSVMSIATGHQVMQRPQPTQPEVPNWSIQPASLCVIHCR